jgi:hypothetical protein
MKHILKTDFGVTATMSFNEDTGQFACVWDGLPKKLSKKLSDKISSQYFPWRNQILKAWSDRIGKKVLVIDL